MYVLVPPFPILCRICWRGARAKLKIIKYPKADPTPFIYAVICSTGVFGSRHLAH